MQLYVVTRSGSYISQVNGEAMLGNRTIVLGAYTDGAHARHIAAISRATDGWVVSVTQVDVVTLNTQTEER